MMQRLSLVILILFSFIFSFSQKGNYQEGFIIKKNGDTIPVSIVKRNWKKQPEEIKIKTSTKDSIIYPEAIKGFIIPSLELEYVSTEIRLAKFNDKFQEATTIKDPELYEAKYLLLKRIYKGRFDLYLFFDKLSRKRFFVESQDNFTELYSHYYVVIYDHPVTYLEKKYEFVLKILMTPCRSLFSIIENIRLDEEQIIQVFKMYDKCLDSKGE